MAFLGGTFDANQVEPQGDYTPIAPGEYKVHILSSEMVETSSKNGHMLKLELEIIEGESAGRKLFDRLNLDNPNAQAVEIAQRQLSAICHATGKLTVQDSEELHGIPMIAVVKVDPPRSANGKEYGASNSIKAYKPIGSAATGAAAPARSGFTPSAAPAASAGKSPPWKSKAA
jgi:hypothetical protein